MIPCCNRTRVLKFPLMLLAFFAVLALSNSASAVVVAGNPDIGTPGGFGIEGNLWANSPSVAPYNNSSDWLPHAGGIGIGVLDASGNPVDATNTFHRIDLTGNDDLDVFAESDKVFHNPNTYNWKAGSVPQKDDIQNGLIHIQIHPITGDLWVVMAGDRRAENGDSYIDFEFLQNTLTKNPDGTFTSLGPDKGRTVGDILLTIELTKGGGAAKFFAQRWAPDPTDTFTYVDFTPPVGTAFVSADTDSTVTIPYSPFTYEINAFGEAAANLSELIAGIDTCFGAKTIWIRTKSSQSPSAQLKDLVEPIQLNLCLDHTPPVISCPSNKVFDCVIGDPGQATATDNCDTDPVITYQDVVLSARCPRVIQRTWTATDNCNNSASCVQTITIRDITNPVISCPPNKVFDCTMGDAGVATATDNCGSVSVTFSDDTTSARCPLVISRTWTATDTCGNSASCVQSITVQDTTDPVISCPPNKVFDCTMGNAGVATATDNCGAVSVTSSDDTTSARCPLVISRTWTATDSCGNSVSCVQSITVQDTTDPVITCPADVVFDCSKGDAGKATATDNCDPDPDISSSDDTTSLTCPLVIKRTWVATDSCGNADTCVQTITVQDTTDPVISCPSNKVFDCTLGDAGTATATDNCDPDPDISSSDKTISSRCPIIIERTWVATDICGNADTCVQTITIRDITDPVITCPDDIVFDCTMGDAGKASATDNCDPDPDISSSDDTTSLRCPIVIKRTWVATDSCGNADTCVQTITVQDTTDPVLTCATDKVFDCTMGNAGKATATDNCDSVVVTSSDDTTSARCPLVIARTWTATDTCGNSVSCVQSITVQDTTDPVISCPSNKVFDCTMGDAGKATATDNCDPDPDISSSDDTTSLRCPLVIKRTWVATDSCGNSKSCVQTITVQDTTKPTISCPANDTVACGAAIIFGDPTASDNCDPDPQISVVSDDVTPGPGPGETTYTRTWEATDSCGNVSATCSQSILREACPTGHIFPTNTTCSDFINGTASDLTQVCYGVKSNYINNTAPGVFFYYTQVTAPSSSFTINVVQTNNNGSFPLFDVMQEDGKPQIILWDANCIKIKNGTNGGGQASVNVTGATVGQIFVVSVKYSTKTVVGTYVPTKPTVHYDFSTNINGGAPFSQDGLDLKNCVGSGVTVAEADQAASEIGLEGNYPNPFNANTTIKYSLPNDGKVTVAVYNIIGQKVITLVDGVQTAGYHTVVWDGKNASGNAVASGVYFYMIQFGNETQTKRMTLLK